MTAKRPTPSVAPRARRHSRRVAALPPRSQCALCHTANPLVLSRKPDGRIICYECDSRERGLTGFEDHHVWGQRIDPHVVRVSGNTHRILEAAKYEWPQLVLQNRDRRPIPLLIGFRLTLRDLGRLLVPYCQAFVDWLLGVHSHLTARNPHYEVGLGLPRLAMEA